MELLIPSPSLAGTHHLVSLDTFCGESREGREGGREGGRKERERRREGGREGGERTEVSIHRYLLRAQHLSMAAKAGKKSPRTERSLSSSCVVGLNQSTSSLASSF